MQKGSWCSFVPLWFIWVHCVLYNGRSHKHIIFYYTAVSACHRDFCELLFKFFIYLFFALFHFNSWQIVQAGMRSGFLSVSRVKLKFATLQDEIWLVKHVCFFWTALLVIAVYIRLSWTSASLRIITWLTGHMWAKDRRMVHCYEKQNDLKWIV